MSSKEKSEYSIKLQIASKNYIETLKELPYQLKRINFTQQVCAEASGITPTTLSNWLNNPESVPPNKLERIAKFFDTFDSAKR